MNVSPARRLLGLSSTQVRNQRIPDFLKSEFAKVAFVGRRKMRDTMMAERESQSGIDDLTEPGVRCTGPLPQGVSDCWFVIPKFPIRIVSETVAKCTSLTGRLRTDKHRWIAKLHLDLNQYQSANKKSFCSICMLGKESSGVAVVRRIRIGCVKKKMGVGRNDHALPRCSIVSTSAHTAAGSIRKSPPQSRVGNCQPA